MAIGILLLFESNYTFTMQQNMMHIFIPVDIFLLLRRYRFWLVLGYVIQYNKCSDLLKCQDDIIFIL